MSFLNIGSSCCVVFRLRDKFELSHRPWKDIKCTETLECYNVNISVENRRVINSPCWTSFDKITKMCLKLPILCQITHIDLNKTPFVRIHLVCFYCRWAGTSFLIKIDFDIWLWWMCIKLDWPLNSAVIQTQQETHTDRLNKNNTQKFITLNRG